ncbi:gas vesicle protein GvpO [Streptomyces purpureus]|uniref:gas vesicle protein GvpO n=1 Tax=Streptomyces purpureus TaxID=1951 RepID=UPI00378DD40D
MAHSSKDGSDSKAEQAEQERPVPVATVIRTATEQLAQLLNQPAEAVSSCERIENGDWRLSVEVLELRRVPDTMSLLASYEVDADHDGQLLGYRRTRRYERGRADRR